MEELRYGSDQHSLICELLKVSSNPNEEGDTAFEAVCSLRKEKAEMFTEEEVMQAYSRGQGDVVDASLMDDYTRPLVEATEFLAQFKTQKGK